MQWHVWTSGKCLHHGRGCCRSLSIRNSCTINVRVEDSLMMVWSRLRTQLQQSKYCQSSPGFLGMGAASDSQNVLSPRITHSQIEWQHRNGTSWVTNSDTNLKVHTSEVSLSHRNVAWYYGATRLTTMCSHPTWYATLKSYSCRLKIRFGHEPHFATRHACFLPRNIHSSEHLTS